MGFVDQFWAAFKDAIGVAPLYIALTTAGLWADRHYGKSEELRLAGALIVGFIVGLVLTAIGARIPFEPWMFAVPLIILGAIVAFQSAAVSSNIAMIILLVIGIFFGFGRGYSEQVLPSTLGAAAGAIMALASGIGLGTVLSGFIGTFVIRIIGLVVAVVGVLMVINFRF